MLVIVLDVLPICDALYSSLELLQSNGARQQKLSAMLEKKRAVLRAGTIRALVFALVRQHFVGVFALHPWPFSIAGPAIEKLTGNKKSDAAAHWRRIEGNLIMSSDMKSGNLYR